MMTLFIKFFVVIALLCVVMCVILAVLEIIKCFRNKDDE